MKTTEVHETNIKSLDKYNISMYSERGIVINTDDTGLKEILFVASFVTMIAIGGDIGFLKIANKEDEQKDESGSVSEDFALKMLGIGMGTYTVKD